jgi:hypothetical protein
MLDTNSLDNWESRSRALAPLLGVRELRRDTNKRQYPIKPAHGIERASTCTTILIAFMGENPHA